MEHTINQIDWIVSYLKGKEVTKNDLKDFFEIQNNERPVKVRNIVNGIATDGIDVVDYHISDCVFTVEMELMPDHTNTYTIKEVSCVACGLNCDDNN